MVHWRRTDNLKRPPSAQLRRLQLRKANEVVIRDPARHTFDDGTHNLVANGGGPFVSGDLLGTLDHADLIQEERHRYKRGLWKLTAQSIKVVSWRKSDGISGASATCDSNAPFAQASLAQVFGQSGPSLLPHIAHVRDNRHDSGCRVMGGGKTVKERQRTRLGSKNIAEAHLLVVGKIVDVSVIHPLAVN